MDDMTNNLDGAEQEEGKMIDVVTTTTTEDELISPTNQLKAKQNKEKKDLKATMKRSVNKNDKKRKKDVSNQVETLEKEMRERHERELLEIEQRLCTLIVHPNSDPEVAEEQLVEVEVVDVAVDKKEEPRLTKAQKRRTKRAERDRRRNQIAEEDEVMAQTSRGRMETEEILRHLEARHLLSHEVPPDGDCLFNALSHQLARKHSANELRSLAAAYISSHMNDFLPFLIGEREEGDSADDEFDSTDYCAKISRSAKKGGIWGGEAELRAISCSLRVQIEVLQPNGQVTIYGEEFKSIEEQPPLIITYHRFAYALGEHYNSTKPIN